MPDAKTVIDDFISKRKEIERERKKEINSTDVECITVKGSTKQESLEKYLAVVKKYQPINRLVYAKFNEGDLTQVILVRKESSVIKIEPDIPDEKIQIDGVDVDDMESDDNIESSMTLKNYRNKKRG